MIKISTYGLIFSLLFNSGRLFAAVNSKDLVQQAFIDYKKGAYQKALVSLKRLEQDGSQKGKALYWQGLCYSRLQEFDEANKVFARAVQFKSQPLDINYEYGQALFAANNLKNARHQFALSAKNKFKPSQSLYYYAYSSQQLEDFSRVRKYYEKLESDRDDLEIAQAASTQLGEIALVQAEKSNDPLPLVKQFVIPQFERAVKIANNSAAISDIEGRIGEIKQKYQIDGVRMENGRKLPEKKHQVRYIQTIGYDSNVTNEADEAANTTATEKSSAVNKVDVNGSYRFDAKKTFTFKPGMRIQMDDYLEDKSEIYENDTYTITGYTYNTIEHKINNQPASMLFDFDYAYTARDRNLDEDVEYYSRSQSITLGEKFQLFTKMGAIQFGDTTIKVKRKMLTNHDTTQDSDTNTINLSQIMILPKNNILIGTFNMDAADVETESSSTTSYLFRADYIGPEVLYGFKIQAAMGLTITDTKKQKETRGTEYTYAPSVEFRREFKKMFETSLKYGFTKNESKAKSTYAYSKHEVSLDLEFDL